MNHIKHNTKKQVVYFERKSANTIVILFIFAFYIFSSAIAAYAETYYIDYLDGADTNIGVSKDSPWKKYPGMKGFLGKYSKQDGDKFIFKGGVSWPQECFPMTIVADGNLERRHEITIDKSWYKGQYFKNPIFDGGGNIASYQSLISLDNRNWITINGIELVNVGKKGFSSQARAIKANPGGEGLIISNCIIIPYGNHAIVINYNGTIDIKNGIKIYNNKISHSTNNIEIATSKENISSINNIEIFNNKIFDPSSQLIGGDHGDGIHIWANSKKYDFYDVKIFSNSFYGDWSGRDENTSSTANIYLEGCCRETAIYNNSHFFSNTTATRDSYLLAPGFIVVGGGENIKVYNNSMSAIKMSERTGNYGVQTGIKIDNVKNVIIKANAIEGTRIGIWVPNSYGQIQIDYNVVKVRSSGDGTFGISSDNKFFGTLFEWQKIGYDLNGKEESPNFIFEKTLGIGPNSPCIGILPVNEQPIDIFSDDSNGLERPINGNWDAGAIQVNSKISPPSGIKIITNQ